MAFSLEASMFDKSFLDAYRDALFARANWNLPWSQEVLFETLAGLLLLISEHCFTGRSANLESC
jgi:hypothetical protein